MKLLLTFIVYSSLAIFGKSEDADTFVETEAMRMGHKRDGDYIVVLAPELTDKKEIAVIVDRLLEGDGKSIYHFNETFVGATVTNVRNEATVTRLSASPLVLEVVPDYSFELDRSEIDVENWGLDRIDELDLPMDGRYRFEHSGKGVEVFVIDSGLYAGHEDFVVETPHCGFDAFRSGTEHVCSDQIGHGTHVAGIIRGLKYGVAKSARLVAVRVHSFHHGSSLSTVLSGFEFVMHRVLEHPNHRKVVNFSLSGPKSPLINSVVDKLVDVGVPVIVSAGNHQRDSCLYSPASAVKAITVAATNHLDLKSPYTNRGPCVDLYAPGSRIQSTWIESSTSTAILSGTSLAAAFVTGEFTVVAQYLEVNPTWTPEDILDELKKQALEGIDHGDHPDEGKFLILNTVGLRGHEGH